MTTRTADGTPHGLTANSFTSVSADPPLVLVCIDLRCSILEHFPTDGIFVINVLGETQKDLSVRFATLPDDRFDGVAWHPGFHGAPTLDGAIGTFECRVLQRIEAGDHVILLGDVLKAHAGSGRPLVYFGRRYAELQKE